MTNNPPKPATTNPVSFKKCKYITDRSCRKACIPARTSVSLPNSLPVPASSSARKLLEQTEKKAKQPNKTNTINLLGDTKFYASKDSVNTYKAKDATKYHNKRCAIT